MDTAQGPQEARLKGLDADTQTVDTEPGQAFGIGCRQAVRIGFERDFCPAGDGKIVPHGRQDLFYLREAEERRRSATEVDRIERRAGTAGMIPVAVSNFPAQGFDVRRDVIIDTAVRRKITVAAFLPAERNVDV